MPTGSESLKLVQSSVAFAVNSSTLYIAVSLIPLQMMNSVYDTYIIFSYVFSVLLLGEAFDFRKAGFIGVSMIGILFVVNPHIFKDMPPVESTEMEIFGLLFAASSAVIKGYLPIAIKGCTLISCFCSSSI